MRWEPRRSIRFEPSFCLTWQVQTWASQSATWQGPWMRRSIWLKSCVTVLLQNLREPFWNVFHRYGLFQGGSSTNMRFQFGKSMRAFYINMCAIFERVVPPLQDQRTFWKPSGFSTPSWSAGNSTSTQSSPPECKVHPMQCTSPRESSSRPSNLPWKQFIGWRRCAFRGLTRPGLSSQELFFSVFLDVRDGRTYQDWRIYGWMNSKAWSWWKVSLQKVKRHAPRKRSPDCCHTQPLETSWKKSHGAKPLSRLGKRPTKVETDGSSHHGMTGRPHGQHHQCRRPKLLSFWKNFWKNLWEKRKPMHTAPTAENQLCWHGAGCQACWHGRNELSLAITLSNTLARQLLTTETLNCSYRGRFPKW